MPNAWIPANAIGNPDDEGDIAGRAAPTEGRRVLTYLAVGAVQAIKRWIALGRLEDPPLRGPPLPRALPT